jgi:chaperonin cofactor prefoldin
MQSTVNYYEHELEQASTQIEQIQDILKITSSQQEIEISNLENVISEIQTSVNTLQNINEELETEVASLNNEISNLNNEISDLEVEISSLDDQIRDKNTDIQNLENELNNVMNLEVTQHYEWDYEWSKWTWDLPIPLRLYWEYHEKPRPTSWATWVSMCKDSRDDYYIKRLVDGLKIVASNEGYSEYETIEYVISFIQTLPYTVDDETTPWNEYPRYPIETLFDRGGDCEDTSILTAMILYEMGYDVALIILEDENHCAVGVKGGEGIYGTYYLVDGTKYFFLETTGDGWGIGDFPDFESGKALVYPLKNY